MDKYIGDIINDERHDTRNSDTEAHDDANFLRYNNYAQGRLYGLITNSWNWAFEKTIEIPIVAAQSDYEINDNLAFGTRITNVEYSLNSDGRYIPISVTPDRYRTLVYSGKPKYYRRRHGTVVIEPTPDVSQGTLRVTYERALDKLALRSAQITGTPSGTDIDLDAPTTTEEAKYTYGEYICVSDINGNPLLYNGVIASYDAGANTLTLAADVDTYLVSGVVLADLSTNGTYVTLGKYTTTHSKLPNEAEAFFVEWVNRKLHNVDSSDQFDETDSILRELKETIVAAYKMPDKARKPFPINDFKMLIPEYE